MTLSEVSVYGADFRPAQWVTFRSGWWFLDAQAMSCALKFNEILNGLPGTVIAPLKTSVEKYFIEPMVEKPVTDVCWRLRVRNVYGLPNHHCLQLPQRDEFTRMALFG
jgi:hypothetical protein